MTNNSPYSTPEAEIMESNPLQEFNLHEPRSRPIGAGWTWISQGFGLFKLSPGGWILMLIVGLIVMIGLNFIPVIGQLFGMLTTYVWLGGIMLGCRDQELGKPMTVEHLFAGFSNNVGKLILLSVMMTAASMAIMFVALGSLYFSILTGDAAGSQEMMNDPIGILSSMLFAFLFMIPLIMAVWFAPALIVLNNVSIGQAIKLSFIGCLKNILPFLLYFILSLILYIVATLPIFLGLLVFFPTMFAAIYTSYKDIFIEVQAED